MDEELEQLTQPDSDVFGWPARVLDELDDLISRANQGEIGIHAWAAGDGRLRADRPKPEVAQIEGMEERVHAAMREAVGEGDGSFSRLLQLLGRLHALRGPVPDREQILHDLAEADTPPSESLRPELRAEIVKGLRHRRKQRERWLRELEAGQDEPRIVLSEEDRAPFADVAKIHLIRTAVALARDGKRPFAEVPKRLLERTLDSEEELDDVTAAVALAEVLADEYFPLPSYLALDGCYTAIGRICQLTFHRWGLRDAAVSFAGDELARPTGGRARPTRTGLAKHCYWSKDDVRRIVDSVEERERTIGPYRPASSHPTPAPASPNRDAALLRKLLDFDELNRHAGVALLVGGVNRYGKVVTLGPVKRPEHGSLSPSAPVPWLRSWWGYHAAHNPELALTCCDPDYLREQIGSAGIALAEAVASAADTRLWTQQLVEFLATRSRLSTRVVALRPRKTSEPGPLPGPAAASKTHPREHGWGDDLVEDVHEVPHVVAEAVVRTGLGNDLGRAGQVSDRVRHAYLAQPNQDWPATRLELARRNASKPQPPVGNA